MAKESTNYRINCRFGPNDPMKKQAYDVIELFESKHKSEFLSIVIDFYLQSLNLDVPLDSDEAAEIIKSDIRIKMFAKQRPGEYKRMRSEIEKEFHRSRSGQQQISFTVNEIPTIPKAEPDGDMEPPVKKNLSVPPARYNRSYENEAEETKELDEPLAVKSNEKGNIYSSRMNVINIGTEAELPDTDDDSMPEDVVDMMGQW